MTSSAFTYEELRSLAGDQLGAHDVPCPVCGPERRTPANRLRRVLRIWINDDCFGTFLCARCGLKGHAHADGSRHRSIDDDTLERSRSSSDAAVRIKAAERLELARTLWRRHVPVSGTIVEHYLRKVRGYHGPVPETIGFLPPQGEHPPAMIAAFGLPEEPEPGCMVLHEAAVRGVHLTRLAPDGSGKTGDPSKIIIGRCPGTPIVISPMGDNLGLAITEGIEDGLSIFDATGLGVWVAGAAGRMPALAATVPAFTDAVSIIADADDAGQRGAYDLAAAFQERNIEAEIVSLSDGRRTAA